MYKKSFVAIGLLILCLVPPMFGKSLSSEHTPSGFSTEPRLTAGGAHSLGLRPDGSVWGWGSNQFGQIGDGTTTTRVAPVRVAGLTGPFVGMSAGAMHSLGVSADGSVWAWGFNGEGQLGDGTTTRRLLPVRVSTLTGVVAVAAGGSHSLALKSDGTLWVWGRNEEGQLGDRSTTRRLRPVRITSLTGAIAISAGALHSLAVLADGTVRAWGANVTGQLGDGTHTTRTSPVRVATLTGITSVSAGGSHSLALRGDGTVWSWGWNAWGQIGDGTRTNRTKPVQVFGVYEATTVSAGGVHSLATTTSGDIWAWGGNHAGQLGDGSTTHQPTPVVIAQPPTGIAVSAGGVHSLALSIDRAAWAWGNNFFGQLGEGSHTGQHVPVPLGGPDLGWGLAQPTFEPDSGTYNDPIWVTVRTTTPGATIHFTTNGDDPTENDQALGPDEPVYIDQPTTLKARAFKAGKAPSDVATAVYSMAAAAPYISPAGGTFTYQQYVSLWTPTSGATIHYTLDGTDPTEQSPEYFGWIAIVTSSTLKARTFRPGWAPSPIAAETYIYNFGTLTAPVAHPPGGVYGSARTVTLTAAAGATIRYTLDGSDPTEVSSTYASPISIAATTTLKARAFRADYAPSATFSVVYVIQTGPPPDPATVAPPLDTTVMTNFNESTKFLYSGSNPIQLEVDPEALEPLRVSVVRGQVRDRDGAALGSVRVNVLNQPQLGYTLTRPDGMFDLVINGGGALTIEYARDGYLPAQRTLSTPWQDFVWAPDVRLTKLDSQVTVVDLSPSAPTQVARATSVSDQDGTRTATLIVPEGGVRANLELADGTVLPAQARLSIRATEYTVGAGGRESMPAALPPTSGYTYAVELSADEAFQAGATKVTFDKPLAFYVENFLDFPVGSIVPAGYYDRKLGLWVAGDNGRIVRILSVDAAGLAELDIDGNHQADDAAALAVLGVTEGERRKLATMYQPGQSLWRVPIPHFTPWDCNWPYAPPRDARSPELPQPTGPNQAHNSCESGGSIIECENQTLGERLPIAGTSLTLNYRSSRQPGRSASRTANIALTNGAVSPSLKRVDVEISVAGQRIQQSFLDPAAASSTKWAWDGRDVYGRPVNGSQRATIVVKHVYDAVYTEPSQFGRAFGVAGSGTVTGNRSRGEVNLEQSFDMSVGTSLPPDGVIGGWSLDVHHQFDPQGATVWFGDGGRRDKEAAGLDVKPMGRNRGSTELLGATAGGSAVIYDFVYGVLTVGRDGSEGGLRTSGIPSECYISGRGLTVTSGPGQQEYYAVSDVRFGGTGLASKLCIGRINENTAAENLATSMTVARDGSVLFGDPEWTPQGARSYARRLSPDGFVTTVLRGQYAEAMYAQPNGDIYVDDGSLKRVAPAQGSALTGPSPITSDDGSQVFEFDGMGRHLRTIDTSTGAALEKFGYDEQGRLASITDVSGLKVVIERDADGTPTAIVAPFGQRTELTVNADGFLAAVSDPEGGTARFSYDTGGLLTGMTTPRGHQYQFAHDDLGRLIRDEDPAGGDNNLYAYVFNDPVNLADPLGLDWVDDAWKTAADFSAGFGDTMTFNVTRTIRQWKGWDGVVDRCSGAYSAGRWTAIAEGLATGGAASLNGGARTVFHSGKGALEAARAGKGAGVLLEETLGGRVLNYIDAPEAVWKGASAIYAANAKGVAQVFLREPLRPGNIFTSVERPIVEFLGNAVLSFK